MLRTLVPPQHRLDVPGQFICDWDTSLDTARLAAELAAMEAERTKRLADEGESADLRGFRPEDHPLTSYWSGSTRFDLKAQCYLMGQPVSLRSYFNQGEPTVFTLKRLSWQRYCLLLDSIEDPGEQLRAFAMAGVTAIKGADVDVTFDSKGVPDEWMQALFDAKHSLLQVLGTAVALYNRPLTDQECGALRTFRAPLQ